jgi:hypothetical protein
LRDRRISIHIAALCVRHSFHLTGTATIWKSVSHGCGRDNPRFTSRVVLEFGPRSCGCVHLGRQSIAYDFKWFVNNIEAWLHFSCEGANYCPDLCGGV